GWTFLALAAAEGKATITRMVLERNDIYTNFPVGEGLTPLTAAIRAGKADTIKALIEKPGVNINSQDRYGGTPLHWAAKQQREGVVTLLL
ncbi:ankyrin, partial [Tuber magnatum]